MAHLHDLANQLAARNSLRERLANYGLVVEEEAPEEAGILHASNERLERQLSNLDKTQAELDRLLSNGFRPLLRSA